MQITVILRSDNPNEAQEIIYSGRYDVNIEEVPNGENWPALSCNATSFEPPLTLAELTDFCTESYDPSISSSLLSGFPDEPVLSSAFIEATNELGETLVTPNPFINELNVQLPQTEQEQPATYFLKNAIGETVANGKLNAKNTSIDLTAGQNLPAGIYFLSIVRTNQSIETHKLIKQ